MASRRFEPSWPLAYPETREAWLPLHYATITIQLLLGRRINLSEAEAPVLALTGVKEGLKQFDPGVGA